MADNPQNGTIDDVIGDEQGNPLLRKIAQVDPSHLFKTGQYSYAAGTALELAKKVPDQKALGYAALVSFAAGIGTYFLIKKKP